MRLESRIDAAQRLPHFPTARLSVSERRTPDLVIGTRSRSKAEGRIAVRDESEGVADDSVVPPHGADDEPEQSPRVAAGEEDRRTRRRWRTGPHRCRG